MHDFALLFDKDGNPLNPPEHPGSVDDPGVMGINYRCEPMRERLKIKNDPARMQPRSDTCCRFADLSRFARR